MAQHFLLSSAAKTLTLAAVLRMSDEVAEGAFRSVRWSATGGEAVCPHCECPTTYECRRPSGLLRFRCKACRKDFSITSGTLFAHHKMPLRTYLAAIAIFVNEVKGKSALAMSRDLGTAYKTAFVLTHKLREAMATELKGMLMGGEGETVEIDGAYFGGYVKPANARENRRDRRLAKNQNGKRRVVVVVRERGGRTLPAVFKTEAQAVAWIKSRVHTDTAIMADEAASWNELHARYEVVPYRSRQALQHRDGDLHQRRGVLFLPDAPGRDWPPPPHFGHLPCPLCPGTGVARRSPPDVQRSADHGGCWAGHGSARVG
jgi:transposase-like protein